ncbi:MAG: hypothetical protein ACHQ17_14905 [Polyangia bacterium]
MAANDFDIQFFDLLPKRNETVLPLLLPDLQDDDALRPIRRRDRVAFTAKANPRAVELALKRAGHRVERARALAEIRAGARRRIGAQLRPGAADDRCGAALQRALGGFGRRDHLAASGEDDERKMARETTQGRNRRRRLHVSL